MNDATQHTIIEALVDKVRALEGDAESYRAQIERLAPARPAGTCEVCGEPFAVGDSVESRHAHHNRTTDGMHGDIVQLCTEVLARADVNASTRRRAERILRMTRGET